ncbi:diacylglycerol kinase [Pseudoalteromonas sp. GB56]
MQFDTSSKPVGFKRITLAFGNTLRALNWLTKNESAFKQELVLLVSTLVLMALLNITIYEKIALLVSVLIVLLAEIINTAIEATIDRVSLDIHPLSGLAKDLGSAGVFVAMVICFAVWVGVALTNHWLKFW